ncbi:MAG: glycosyltransferase [Pseudomonadota bacterium]
MKGRVAVVVKGYPRLSETFIAQEILALERRGLDLLIVSLRHPTDGAIHDLHAAIKAPVLYLPEYLKDDPQRVRRGRAVAQTLPGYRAAEAIYRRDLARDPTASRHRRWGQAAVLAAELPADVSQLYVHFLHTPASVTCYAATLRGLPFAFSAHAKDIYTTPTWELREKIAASRWGVTCTAYNHHVLSELADAPGKVDLVYHGLDPAPFDAPDRRGRGGPFTILSVCRAVEKKGLDDVIHALARLPRDLDWRFGHMGGGSLVPHLKTLAARLGLADRVTFTGTAPRKTVVAALARADAFVLASRVAKNGDRDGIPNVLMEAMVMGLPVVSTKVSAVPELVTPATGILVEPRDRGALGEALARLAADPSLREAMGREGEARVKAHFSPKPGIDRLIQRFEDSQTADLAA